MTHRDEIDTCQNRKWGILQLFVYLIVQIQEIGEISFRRLIQFAAERRGNASFARVNEREFIESCVHNLNRIIESYFGLTR
jgi:hypothetical protein